MALFINGLPNVPSLDDFFFCPGYLLCWRRMMKPAAIYSFNAWLYSSFLISYGIIVVCYWKVFRAVQSHNAAVVPNLNQANQSGQGGSHTEEVSVAKAVAAIVLSFTFCWIPAEVMDTMDKINPLLLPRQVRFPFPFHSTVMVFQCVQSFISFSNRLQLFRQRLSKKSVRDNAERSSGKYSINFK